MYFVKHPESVRVIMAASDDEQNEEKFVYVQSKRTNTQFINLYRSLPELWDPKHPCYGNKLKRQQAKTKLLQVLRLSVPNATEGTVTKHINILRTNYRRLLKKHWSSRRVEDGRVFYDFVPTCYKFHLLRFLDPTFKSSAKSDLGISYVNIPIDEDTSKTEYTIVGEICEEPDYLEEEEIPYKVESSKAETDFEKDENSDNEFLSSSDLKMYTDPETRALGQMVAMRMQRMPEEQRLHAELLINKVLIYGLRSKLSDATDLTGVTEYLCE